MGGDLVQLEVDEGVGIVRLNRPPMNAINEELTRGLFDVTIEVSNRADVRAVVVWGGDKVFAAGADVNMMVEMSPLDVRPMITGLQDTFNLVEEIPKVTIAAITRFALGGGLELAMCADFRFAAEDARLGQPEINLGIIPGAGGTQRLPRAVGKAKAMDLVLTGRMMDAAEAERAGLVSRVVPADKLIEEAFAAAAQIAEFSLPSVMMAKESVNRAFESPLAEGMLFERRLFHALFATEDQKEGMAAFVEKRKPKFRHK